MRSSSRGARSARTSSRGSPARAAARGSRCSRTRTPCSPTRPSGGATPGRASSVDGEVWGRGALDMKGHVAAAPSRSPRSRAKASGRRRPDLRRGGRRGGRRRRRPAVARARASGGRARRVRDQRGRRRPRRASAVARSTSARCAEKMSSPFRLRVHGRSGHASMPGIADNALVKAARLIERLGEYLPERAPRARDARRLLERPLGEVPAPGGGARARGGDPPARRARLSSRCSR